MAKSKNITNKEIQRRFNFLAQYMQELGMHVQSLKDLIIHYINFNGDEDKLAKYLEKLTKEQKKLMEEKEHKDNKEWQATQDAELK